MAALVYDIRGVIVGVRDLIAIVVASVSDIANLKPTSLHNISKHLARLSRARDPAICIFIAEALHKYREQISAKLWTRFRIFTKNPLEKVQTQRFILFKFLHSTGSRISESWFNKNVQQRKKQTHSGTRKGAWRGQRTFESFG
ncbi:hypothetical protein [Agrobacterium rosae]|uniref:Uncharacterized protein n=1 Tax=Agrobacterium rosae TaxID=1972867 RepID=A0AAW9FSC2_9HYPH|nr:hypothetical protein [Agrobacterium rosae]MDX8305770.1 hypothetical protein [Agrobacterium rosae]